MNKIKTAESVTPSHPDKMCDIISDAILDACLEQDPNSRVAIETMGGHGIITVTGELTTKAEIDIHEIVRSIVGQKYGIQTNIVKQSQFIAQGVNDGGAGDQGIMVGYACDENEEMIPQELYLARALAKYIYKKHPYDGKTQVTLRDGKIDTVVISFQNVKKEELRELAFEFFQVNSEEELNFKIYTNPAGDWEKGGFDADTGLTGRKLAVDNYGTEIAIGGGAFSGKDYTKVDRSGAYMARRIAVDLLREREAKEVTVKLAYSIGIEEPVMAIARIKEKDGVEVEIDIKDAGYNLTPKGIKEYLNLDRPIYKETAKWGHFGQGFSWDR